MLRAVIDLGTNTFHLLIAERDTAGRWRHRLRERIYVKLAEDGIGEIGPGAWERGKSAMKIFQSLLEEAGIAPEQVQAFGTAALRTASNGIAFIEAMEKETGILAKTITGDQEAMLIYRGVREAVPFPEERVLIMDIGGGSVEFILADREQVFWHRSFPIGVAVLFRQFHRQDPMSRLEIDSEETFLEHELQPLWEALDEWPTFVLIGASGTFDVIDNFILDPETKPETYGAISPDDFWPLYEFLVGSTLEERRAMPKLPEERVEMVVVALVLVQYVLRRAEIRQIYTSAFALKEGMLAEME